MADDTDAPTIEQLRAQRQQVIDNQPVVAAPASDAPTVAGSDAPTIEELAAARKALQVTGGITPPANPPASPTTTATGVARNVAAGDLDAVANTGNVVSDPFSYLVGRPLLMGGAFVHDAIAPYLGWNRLTNQQRSDLYGATSEFADGWGNSGVNLVGRAINASPNDVKANSPTEAAARNVTGAVGSTLMLGQGGVPAVSAAVGALAGQKAAEYVPDWAKDATQAATNVAAATATGAAIPAAATASKNVALRLGSTDPETAATALTAQQYGIDLRGPQLGLPTIQKGVLGATSAVPLSGYGSEVPRIQAQYHSAIANELGEDLGSNTRITSPILDAATQGIASTKRGIEMNTPVAADRQYGSTIADIETQARATLPPADADTVVKLIGSTIQNGGNYDTALTSVRSAMQNPGVPAGVKHFAGQIESAAQDDLIRNAPDADSMDYQTAVRQGKVADVLHSIPRQADGTFNPQDFHAAVQAAKTRGILDSDEDENLLDLGHVSGLIPSAPSKLSSNIHMALKAGELAASTIGGHLTLGGLGGPAAAVGVPVASRLAGAYLRSKGLADTMIRNGTMRGTGSQYTIPSLLPANPLAYVPEATNQTNPLTGGSIPTIYVTPKQQPASP